MQVVPAKVDQGLLLCRILKMTQQALRMASGCQRALLGQQQAEGQPCEETGASVTCDLGADRLIAITVTGENTPMGFEGLLPYLSATREAWFAPSCDDGLDNDADGLVDFPDDPGCTSASDDSERNGSPRPRCGLGFELPLLLPLLLGLRRWRNRRT